MPRIASVFDTAYNIDNSRRDSVSSFGSSLDLASTTTSDSSLILASALSNNRPHFSRSSSSETSNPITVKIPKRALTSPITAEIPKSALTSPIVDDNHTIKVDDTHTIDIEESFGQPMVDLVQSLLKYSPTFKERVIATLDHLKEDTLHIKYAYQETPKSSAYTSSGDNTIHFTNALFKLDSDKNPISFKNPSEQIAAFLVHELGHIDPRNDIPQDAHLFDSGGNLTNINIHTDHDPAHSQYIMGIM